MSITELGEAGFSASIAKGISVVLFSTSDMVSKNLSEMLNNLSRSMLQIRFYKVNMGTSHVLSKQYEVTVVPSILIFKDGVIIYFQGVPLAAGWEGDSHV